MKDGLLKSIIKRTLFLPGAVRQIQFGPLRGMVFRVSEVTGLAAWYSGVERDHQRAFTALIQPGDTVIDVGANWGSHTLLFSKLVGAMGRVIALEPFPKAATELEWHLQANHCQNVKMLRIAASNQEGQAFFTVTDSSSTGGLSATHADQRGANQIAVTTSTLDGLVTQLKLGRITLIKVDVEGAESRVLEGAVDLIRKHRPRFIIDLHTPEQDLSVAQFLIERGYNLSRLSGPPIKRTDAGWPNQDGVWGTIIATP